MSLSSSERRTQARENRFLEALERVESNAILTRDELSRLAELYPNMAVDYLTRHGNDNSLNTEDLLPAVWNLSRNSWDAVRQCAFLYRKHEMDVRTTYLMRKAINMLDKELYDHIVKLGMDPFDREGEYYDYFSEKNRKRAGLLRNDARATSSSDGSSEDDQLV